MPDAVDHRQHTTRVASNIGSFAVTDEASRIRNTVYEDNHVRAKILSIPCSSRMVVASSGNDKFHRDLVHRSHLSIIPNVSHVEHRSEDTRYPSVLSYILIVLLINE